MQGRSFYGKTRILVSIIGNERSMWSTSHYLYLVILFFLCGTISICTSFAQHPFFAESGELNYILLPTRTPPSADLDTFRIRQQLAKGLNLMSIQPDSSFYLINDGLQKSFSIRFDYGIALAYSHLAVFYRFNGDYDRSLNYYSKAMPYARRGFKNPNTLAMFYSGLSTIYYYKNLYDSMFFFTNKAEQLIDRSAMKRTADVCNVASIYTNAGSLWCAMGDYEKAITYFFKGLYTLQPYRDSNAVQERMVTAYNNIGWTYYRSGDTTRSAYYYRKALEEDPKDMLARAGYGQLLVKMGRLQEAMAILQGVDSKEDKEHDFFSLVVARVVLGKVYYGQGQYHKSKKVLEQVLQQVGKASRLESLWFYDAYDLLSAIYKQEGQYNLAYENLAKAKAFLQTQLQREKVAGVYQKEMKIQAALKDKQIAQEKLLLSEHKSRLREKNTWMVAICCGAVLLAVALVALSRSSRHKQRLQMEQINSISKEQEINHLKAMIKGEEKERSRLAGELHDGIMVQLSTVKMGLKSVPESYYRLSCGAYIQTPYYKGIVQQMEEVTVELRRTAHNLMPDMLLEGGLADAVFYFCNTLKHSGLYVSCQQHGTVPRQPADFELSIFRIIQELLQNVVKHAGAKRIMVQLAEVGGHILAVTVEDDGKGFDPANLPEERGMGLKSIASRMQVLKGIMDIRSGPGEGTSIHLEFEMPVAVIITETENEQEK